MFRAGATEVSARVLLLPENYNDFGHQNFISYFKLMNFRDAWVRIGNVNQRNCVARHFASIWLRP
jgi:hypothetical protein